MLEKKHNRNQRRTRLDRLDHRLNRGDSDTEGCGGQCPLCDQRSRQAAEATFCFFCKPSTEPECLPHREKVSPELVALSWSTCASPATLSLDSPTPPAASQAACPLPTSPGPVAAPPGGSLAFFPPKALSLLTGHSSTALPHDSTEPQGPALLCSAR